MPDSPETLAGFLRARLDRFAASGRTVTMWLRDDDAITPTSELDQLLYLTDRHTLPMGLAVIPANVTEKLATSVAPHNRLAVLQHGWAHTNHQPPGEKSSELGDARPVSMVLAELANGQTRLGHLFGEQFAAVLVPPWNRVNRAITKRREEIGLPGLSTFNSADQTDPGQVNTHVDLISWRTNRGFVGWGTMGKILGEEIDKRDETGSMEPIGILTHHLDHDRDCWVFLDVLLQVAGDHPAVLWPDIGALFGLTTR